MPVKSDMKLLTLPCAFHFEDDPEGKLSVPGVHCAYQCANCGWNPEEQKRRVREGQLVTAEDGKAQLRFPRRKENTNAPHET